MVLILQLQEGDLDFFGDLVELLLCESLLIMDRHLDELGKLFLVGFLVAAFLRQALEVLVEHVKTSFVLLLPVAADYGHCLIAVELIEGLSVGDDLRENLGGLIGTSFIDLEDISKEDVDVLRLGGGALFVQPVDDFGLAILLG